MCLPLENSSLLRRGRIFLEPFEQIHPELLGHGVLLCHPLMRETEAAQATGGAGVSVGWVLPLVGVQRGLPRR